MSTLSTSAVEVKNLTYIYRGKKSVVANDDLTFEVKRGEVFGLLGHNGAGKTTLVMQMIGLLIPTQGEIIVNGVNVARDPEKVKAMVGYLPQTQVPLRYLEVRQALHFTGRLRGLTENDTRKQVAWLLDALDLGEYATSYVNKLSGGLLRMTNFAMALIGDPQLLILDEPSNNLDPQRRRQMWDMLHWLNQERGLSCVLVTHNIAEAEQIMHRVVVMQNGQIITQGTPGTIKQKMSQQQQVQLDVWFKSLVQLPASLMTQLPKPPTQIRAGQYRVQLPMRDAFTIMETIVQTVGQDELDDFRIAPISLEDVYLNLEQTSNGLEDTSNHRR